MNKFDISELKELYIPPKDAHKGMSGKLMIIGGSKLFHGASLWALKVASRIVDMVFYSSVEENNEIALKLKEQFFDCIIVPRDKLDEYIKETDCVLIGPGLPRKEGLEPGDDDTLELTVQLLTRYKDKQWVIDGGSIQEIQPETIPPQAIMTPHRNEFETLKSKIQKAKFKIAIQNLKLEQQAEEFSKEYNCIVLLKGEVDIVCSPSDCVEVFGGNPGMTKGGTGDVLAGLVAALACKNEPFLAVKAGSFINKKAGDELFKRVGPYFNASDLCDEIPRVMKELLIK